MNKNYKLTIAYDGSRFFGWERQPGRDTIQGKLETVLAKLTGAPADVIGAGRTDAGVHARAMVASVRLDTDLSPEEIRDYLNRYLPDAIAVREVKEAASASTRATTRWGKRTATPASTGRSSPSLTGNTSPCWTSAPIWSGCSARRRCSPGNTTS